MLNNWSIKQIYTRLGFLLLIVASIQIFMFLTSQNMIVHFVISFVALFIALLMVHSINIKLKRQRRKK